MVAKEIRRAGALLVSLALASCRTVQEKDPAADPVFSFSQCELPSLADINQGKFRTRASPGWERLTNVHPSFDASFTLLHDRARDVYFIQDQSGLSLFQGHLDGVPRYVACVDVDRDHDADVLVELAAYGNHGNGTESFELLLNENGRLTHVKDSIRIEFNRGQENRAGVLTWHSSPNFCAVFDGEEAEVSGSGTETDPILVGAIRKVREVWGHSNGRMRLISKTATPIVREDVRHMTYR